MDQRRRQGAIDAQLLALRGDIRRAQAKQRAKAKAQARAWVLGVSLLRVVVLIYWLADGVVDPAVFYLRQRGHQHHWSDEDDEELADLVEQVFADTADADVLALTDADDPLDVAALKEATRYGLQWRLRTWTLAQNRKGVAVPAGDNLEEFEARRLEQPPALRPAPWGDVWNGAARMRLSRWRWCFNGRVDEMRAREVVDAAHLWAEALPMVSLHQSL